MRAVVTRPGAGRAWVAEIPEPTFANTDDVVVEMLRVGVCGTDRHVMARARGDGRGLPPDTDYLVLGHEAVGRVINVGTHVQHLKSGDIVVPTVRRGCGECPACAVGQADLCFTGRIRERGIVGLHGFLSERIVDKEENLIRIPDELAPVAPLVESLCTPEKALRRIGNARAHRPAKAGPLYGVQRDLVTGAGPIALLPLMSLRLRALTTLPSTHNQAHTPAVRLIEQAGASYIPLQEVDVEQPQARMGWLDPIIEATAPAECCVAMCAAIGPNRVLDLV